VTAAATAPCVTARSGGAAACGAAGSSLSAAGGAVARHVGATVLCLVRPPGRTTSHDEKGSETQGKRQTRRRQFHGPPLQ